MNGETLFIEQLYLKVPGIDADGAARLGKEVVQQIAAGLPAGGVRRDLGALELTILAPKGTPRDHLAMLIAEAVLGRLA